MVIKKWIEELKDQPWSREKKANDQPAFNWALDNKLVNKVDLYLLPHAAFPTGGLYFENKTWVRETKGMHVIIHNNYILGFEKKIKRFHDYDLWLVDDHADEKCFLTNLCDLRARWVFVTDLKREGNVVFASEPQEMSIEFDFS
ncbi:hypothetical protein ACFX1Q_020675 [Malus domestica]